MSEKKGKIPKGVVIAMVLATGFIVVLAVGLSTDRGGESAFSQRIRSDAEKQAELTRRAQEYVYHQLKSKLCLDAGNPTAADEHSRKSQTLQKELYDREFSEEYITTAIRAASKHYEQNPVDGC